MIISEILPGIDALRTNKAPAALGLLRAAHCGLVTNHTGCTVDGVTTFAVLRDLGIKVQALFAPEHGPTGTREGDIESSTTDEGLPIHSLYGETRRLTSDMVEGLDAIIFDLQDVGARFYTYSTTLAFVLEECARYNVTVVILDRLNPIGGEVIEGPGLDDECRSFVGHLKVPVRHGMTLGELARLHCADEQLKTSLHIIPIINWQRSILWPDSGLPWVVPSPNLPDYTSAAWYPGLCLLEYSQISVGRGTEAPFQIMGAPWLDSERVIKEMSSWPPLGQHDIVGEAIEFVPGRAVFQEEKCRGIRFRVPASADNTPQYPAALGMALLATLHRVHPQEFDEEKMHASLRLLGSQKVLNTLLANDIPNALQLARADALEFQSRRQPFLMY